MTAFNLLVGDISNNGVVNSSDVSTAKAQSGTPTTGMNFRLDVTANGTINSSDVSAVKAQSGTQFPASPVGTGNSAAAAGKRQ